MRLLELFSGTGSFSKVAKELGWETLSLDIEAGGTYSGGGLVPGFSSDEDDDDEYYGEEADANEHEQVGWLGGSQPSSAQSSSRSGLSSGPPSFNSRGRPDVRV